MRIDETLILLHKRSFMGKTEEDFVKVHVIYTSGNERYFLDNSTSLELISEERVLEMKVNTREYFKDI